MFLDTGKPACSDNCQPSCGCGKYVEIWNDVFMEYYQAKDGSITKLKQQNVDTGFGLERMTMLLQGKETPFDTELFAPVMDKLKEIAKQDNIESRRIVAEHLRASMMVISDGGRPSNIDRGYVLRKLIRRMTRHLNKLQIDLNEISELIDLYVETLKELYPELVKNKETIKGVILAEKDKFVKTLSHGEKEFEKVVNKLKQENKNTIDGYIIFKLYETYGFPPEITADLAKEQGLEIEKSELVSAAQLIEALKNNSDYNLENPKADFYYLVTLKNIKWKGLPIADTEQKIEHDIRNLVGSPYSPKVFKLDKNM